MSAHTEHWPRPHRLTVEQYHRMAEVGVLPPEARVELIEGAIIDMAPIGSRHAAAVNHLARQLIRAVGESALVSIQGPLRLSAYSELQPDLAVLRPRSDEYANAPPAVADAWLLIEVSDTTLRFDLDIKAKLYAQHGISDSWVVDLTHTVLHRLWEPRDGGYAQSSAVGGGILPIPSLDAAVDLTSLFAAVS